MQLRNQPATWLCAVLLMAIMPGCAAKKDDAATPGSSTAASTDTQVESETTNEPATKEVADATTEPEAEPVAKEDVTPKETVVAKAPAEPATEKKPAAEKPAAEKKPAAPAKAATAKPPTVDSPLTAGIPGEGPLTTEEIKKWLEDPKNHEVIDFELPLGMASAQAAIKGLDENPLTLAKIELGRQLYFDPRLSSDVTVSCASCHDPDEGYARQTQFGVGVDGQEGGRNSPVSYNRILSDKQFWDGRAESLEAQAVGPIANPIEMGNTHDACVVCLKGIEGYRLQFESIFGDEGVTIDNVGRALASFERVIVTGASPFDYAENAKRFADLSDEELAEIKTDDPEFYAEIEQAKKDAEAHPMSESAQRGWALFFDEQKTDCKACHAGANFTDEQYHNLGVGMDADDPDLGRFTESKDEKHRGAFKTPTLRNVEFSAPYMHDGSQQTLEEVVEWYAKGGHPNPHLSDKIKKLDLTDQDKADLVAFMKALTGPFPKVERNRLPK